MKVLCFSWIHGHFTAANIAKGHKARADGSSCRTSHIEFNGNKESEVGNKRKDTEQLKYNESKSKRRKDAAKGSASIDKVFVSLFFYFICY